VNKTFYVGYFVLDVNNPSTAYCHVVLRRSVHVLSFDSHQDDDNGGLWFPGKYCKCDDILRDGLPRPGNGLGALSPQLWRNKILRSRVHRCNPISGNNAL